MNPKIWRQKRKKPWKKGTQNRSWKRMSGSWKTNCWSIVKAMWGLSLFLEKSTNGTRYHCDLTHCWMGWSKNESKCDRISLVVQPRQEVRMKQKQTFSKRRRASDFVTLFSNRKLDGGRIFCDSTRTETLQRGRHRALVSTLIYTMGWETECLFR